MKKLELPLLLLAIAGAMLAASPVEASEKVSSKSAASSRSGQCRKVSVAMVNKTSVDETAPRDEVGRNTSEPYFNNDYAAQHPSGG